MNFILRVKKCLQDRIWCLNEESISKSHFSILFSILTMLIAHYDHFFTVIRANARAFILYAKNSVIRHLKFIYVNFTIYKWKKELCKWVQHKRKKRGENQRKLANDFQYIFRVLHFAIVVIYFLVFLCMKRNTKLKGK